MPNALRMCRFYVRAAYRRGGVGQQLAAALLSSAMPNRLITATAAPASIPFWESIGFWPDQRDGHTHILSRANAWHPDSSPLSPLLHCRSSSPLPGERASVRFLEFFAANIRNPHTRRAYYRAAEEFLAWCAAIGVPSIANVQPLHVSTWIKAATHELAAPSVKQRPAALRHLFAWLVNGQVAEQPGAYGARASARRHLGQTPVLDPTEARALLDTMSRHRPGCATAR